MAILQRPEHVGSRDFRVVCFDLFQTNMRMAPVCSQAEVLMAQKSMFIDERELQYEKHDEQRN
jgi:hypothetical protein